MVAFSLFRREKKTVEDDLLCLVTKTEQHAFQAHQRRKLNLTNFSLFAKKKVLMCLVSRSCDILRLYFCRLRKAKNRKKWRFLGFAYVHVVTTCQYFRKIIYLKNIKKQTYPETSKIKKKTYQSGAFSCAFPHFCVLWRRKIWTHWLHYILHGPIFANCHAFIAFSCFLPLTGNDQELLRRRHHLQQQEGEEANRKQPVIKNKKKDRTCSSQSEFRQKRHNKLVPRQPPRKVSFSLLNRDRGAREREKTD